MNIEELKQYNNLVIESAKEVSKPWKFSTFILAILLILMVSLYFLCPAEYIVDQNFSGESSFGTVNYQNS